MATAGTKRPRDSDVSNSLRAGNAPTTLAGVTAANNRDGATTSGSRKKAKTSNANNTQDEDYDELADDTAGQTPFAVPTDSYLAALDNAAPTTAAATDPPSSTAAPPMPPVDVPTSPAEHQPQHQANVLHPPSNDGASGQTAAVGLAAPSPAIKPPAKRAQRKSALAAKDKIIAAESAADEMDDDEPVSRAPAKDPQPDAAEATKPASGSLVPPTVVPGRSRGRGGDRVPTTSPPDANSAQQIAASNTAAAIAALSQHQAQVGQGGLPPGAPHDPSNPYLVRYGDPNNPYAHIGMAPPPGMLLNHNPYMPPGPGGYPIFPGMMAHGGPPYPMMHLPPGFDVQGQQNQQNNEGGGEGGEKKDGDNQNASGTGEGGTADGGNNTNAAGENAGQSTGPAPPGVPQQHPYGAYAFAPGFAAHMPPPEFVTNPNDPHAPHPYPHAHLLPPMHHPHPPNPHQSHGSSMPHPGMQLTLPLAVTDHTLPSHLDALIRAPDSLTISYAEVPDGAYLLRTDFGEPYPKQLEPPRKTTEMRCLFCKRHYSGPNARGMWRRHVTGKHDFVFERKAGSVGHTGGRTSASKSAPMVLDSADEGGEGPNGTGNEGEGGNSGAGPGPGEGNPGGGEMTMVGPEGMMGLLSMNGMPVHPMPPGHHPQMMPHMPPGMGSLQMLPGTNIPLSSIPPHPMPPTNKRRPTAPRGSTGGGVGMGNGGGGLVPRVHPLLSKEERIERARASKRHYAMKRRALEKMKQGGIPKGARLIEGMFILTDGTQIPADPNVEYRDLSAQSTSRAGLGGGSGRGGSAGDGDEEGDEDYDEAGAGGGSGKKRPRRSSAAGVSNKKGKGKPRGGRNKKRMDDEIDDDEDEEVEGLVDEGPSMTDEGAGGPEGTDGLVRMDAPTGISVDMDPWQDQSATTPAYHAQLQTQAQGSAAQQVGMHPTPPYPGKLAEVPIVSRGFKPPPMHGEMPPPMASSAAPPKAPRKGAAKKKAEEAAAATEVPAAAQAEGAVEPAADVPATRTRKASARGKAAVEAEQHQQEEGHQGDQAAPQESGDHADAAPATSLPPGIIPPGEDEEERRFCYCDDVEYGNMIGCDNGPSCPREWFHLACTDIDGPIPSSWFCRDCRQHLPNSENPNAPPVDTSMEVGASSIPAVVTDDAEQPEVPAAAEEGMPKLRARRGRPPKAKPVEHEPSPPPPPAPKKGAKKGAKRGRKPKAKVEAEDGEDEPPFEPEEHDEENEVESEDELEVEDGQGQANAAGPQAASSAKKPASELKVAPTSPDSPGRTRRSTRMAAMQVDA